MAKKKEGKHLKSHSGKYLASDGESVAGVCPSRLSDCFPEHSNTFPDVSPDDWCYRQVPPLSLRDCCRASKWPLFNAALIRTRACSQFLGTPSPVR